MSQQVQSRLGRLLLLMSLCVVLLSACASEPEETPTVLVFGAFTGQDAARFADAVRPFEEETGIDVIYEGSESFEGRLQQRVAEGNPPDVAAFPQPGLMADFVARGEIVALSSFLSDAHFEENYDQSWLDMATIDDEIYGVWHRASLKSLVWYSVPAFEAAAYSIPTTWAELLALMDQIVADGGTPWCIGIVDGGATGWVATDWVEDIMLRTSPVEAYDAWTSGELPFDSPEVREAIDLMSQIWLDETYVFGGRSYITSTTYFESPLQMFDEDPNCLMHRQASFITTWFPEDFTFGEDVGVFYFPPIDPALGRPALVAGDLYAMFNDRPEVRQLMTYLSTAESMRPWVESGGALSPHRGASLDWYSGADRAYAAILSQATVTRFDGSDLMPGEVGAGSFWDGMVSYINGADLDRVLTRIDESWPR
ncbi:MAG: carbohydrate ABC transporter substrate-binding protein [Chloroflexi bacterium]|nr:carbohydrate ABC transporter substrate-binding protein [Chloroflexota bacterium]